MDHNYLLLIEELPGRRAKGRNHHRDYMSSSCSSRGEKIDEGYGGSKQRQSCLTKPWSYRNQRFHHLAEFLLPPTSGSPAAAWEQSFAALERQKTFRKHFSNSHHLPGASCTFVSLLSRHSTSCQPCKVSRILL